ncbi:hypothetical protein [Rhizobium tubonense]|uniref:Uncharacterized protein n=1 Tax=Rhizobium tubonense TaxID=484088 RepID=A0A2W4C5X5_9HYPH|nr:hypothetical protein [Rhizobium tubonense]PZM08932.1 hypothetical protein CPY51_27380 [Rhizobium tubonense]
MSVSRLMPDGFYWARSIKHGDAQLTVVQVSTIFGEEPEYWTLVVPGSDQHHMLVDFEIICRVDRPQPQSMRDAAE